MAAAAPYLLAVGGAIAKSSADAQQADQRRTQLNQALARTNETQQKANTMIEGEANKLSPVARAAAMNLQTDLNATGSKSDLAAAGATDSGGNAIINTAGDNGAVSKEFLTSKADRAISEGTRLTALAQQLAKVRAPGQVQEQEGQDRADLTQQLGSMWDSTQHLNGANEQTAQGIELPAYAALGDVAQAAGTAYAGKGKGVKSGLVWSGGDGAPPAGYGWKNGVGGM